MFFKVTMDERDSGYLLVPYVTRYHGSETANAVSYHNLDICVKNYPTRIPSDQYYTRDAFLGEPFNTGFK